MFRTEYEKHWPHLRGSHFPRSNGEKFCCSSVQELAIWSSQPEHRKGQSAESGDCCQNSVWVVSVWTTSSRRCSELCARELDSTRRQFAEYRNTHFVGNRLQGHHVWRSWSNSKGRLVCVVPRYAFVAARSRARPTLKDGHCELALSWKLGALSLLNNKPLATRR